MADACVAGSVGDGEGWRRVDQPGFEVGLGQRSAGLVCGAAQAGTFRSGCSISFPLNMDQGIILADIGIR